MQKKKFECVVAISFDGAKFNRRFSTEFMAHYREDLEFEATEKSLEFFGQVLKKHRKILKRLRKKGFIEFELFVLINRFRHKVDPKLHWSTMSKFATALLN